MAVLHHQLLSFGAPFIIEFLHCRCILRLGPNGGNIPTQERMAAGHKPPLPPPSPFFILLLLYPPPPPLSSSSSSLAPFLSLSFSPSLLSSSCCLSSSPSSPSHSRGCSGMLGGFSPCLRLPGREEGGVGGRWAVELQQKYANRIFVILEGLASGAKLSQDAYIELDFIFSIN